MTALLQLCNALTAHANANGGGGASARGPGLTGGAGSLMTSASGAAGRVGVKFARCCAASDACCFFHACPVGDVLVVVGGW